MPDPEALRIIPLALFAPLFILGVLGRPVFFPISYMTLWLTKLANYYPFIPQLKIELLVALAGLLLVFFKTGDKANEYLSTRNNRVHKYLLILLGCMFISFLVAWDKQYSWDIKIYDFIKVIILYLMITLSVENEGDLKIFIWFFLIFYIYLTYDPVYYFLTGEGGNVEIYGQTYIADSGLLGGHVAMANNMNQMIPFALFLFLGTRNKILKAIAVGALILFIVGLVGSKSRGGVAGFLVLGFIIVYFSEKKMRNSLIVLVLGFVVFLSSGDMGDTLSRIDSTSAHGRFSGLSHGFDMILKGNVLGVGPGCYLIARGHYYSYTMESHNIYGQVMGDLGIPGTIAAFFFMRQMFIYLLSSRKHLMTVGKGNSFLFFMATAILISLATRLVVSMATHGLYFYYYYVMAALSVAIARMSGVDMQAASFKTKENQIKALER